MAKSAPIVALEATTEQLGGMFLKGAPPPDDEEEVLQENNQEYQQKKQSEAITNAEVVKKVLSEPSKEKIVKTLASLTKADLSRMRQVFEDTNKTSLIAEISKSNKGDLKDALQALVESTVELKARTLYWAMKGIGTSDIAIIDVLAYSTNQEIKDILAYYDRKYVVHSTTKKPPGGQLVYDIEKETGGNFRRVLLELLKAERDESTAVNEALAEEEAIQLYKKGEGKWGTDNDFFIKLFTTRSTYHLKVVDLYYKQHFPGSGIIRALRNETGGSYRDLLMALVAPWECWFAQRANTAIKGLGTDDRLLIYILTLHDVDKRKVIAKEYEVCISNPGFEK
eukprot:TRINITY_DN6670_c0_g1_i2.p1 TRINITY_DN6670_c0_g1~~TRINITY_DN6670_c0_g1_i2.p1  ORF type:complete len:339 (-),score=54.47 TRINITY_DN6670_c0_g1_i2:825-1841(-)